MAKLVQHALALDRKVHVEDSRMADQEGQAALAQATERPHGRPFNPGVPKAANPRKSRKGRYR